MKRDLYVSSYQRYVLARESYLKNQTVQNKENLNTALRQFLYDRGKLLSGYFELLINKGEDIISKELLDELKSWQVWLERQEKNVISLNRTEDLISLNDKLVEIYPQMERTTYYFWFNFGATRQNTLVNSIFELEDKLRPFNNEGVWSEEIAKKLNLLKENQIEARGYLDEIKVRRKGDILRGWNRAEKLLVENNRLLKESLEILDEIVDNTNFTNLREGK